MIPKLLHQTWKTKSIPSPFEVYSAKWRRLHPNWEFRLWTDQDLRELVHSRYPHLASMYDAYPKPIMRADLGRYLILREFGGVYADLDTEPLQAFEKLLAVDAPVFAYEPTSHVSSAPIRARGFRALVSNAIIFSPKHHPFWDHLLATAQQCQKATNPLDATGSFMLTVAVETCLNERPVVLPSQTFSPSDKSGGRWEEPVSPGEPFAIHHRAGTWWRPPAAPWWKKKLKYLVERFDQRSNNFMSIPPGAEGNLAPIENRRFAESLHNIPTALRPQKSSRVLLAIPARDATDTIGDLIEQILSLEFPRDKISVAFFESDSVDDTLLKLLNFKKQYGDIFRRIEVISRSFNEPTPIPRWKPASQLRRRAHIARVRNELLEAALKDEDWVLWIDADIVEFPPTILQSLMDVGLQIVQPNAVRTRSGPSMDLNAWSIERQISVDSVNQSVRDGLYQPSLDHGRLYLSDLRYREIVSLDGVGGTMLLVDADLHRAGLIFPETPYRFLIETEGFAAAANDLGIIVGGLPNVEIRHSPR